MYEKLRVNSEEFCVVSQNLYVFIRVLFRVIPYDNVAFVIILQMNFGTVAGRIVLKWIVSQVAQCKEL